jgi:hypothetical protein
MLDMNLGGTGSELVADALVAREADIGDRMSG